VVSAPFLAAAAAVAIGVSILAYGAGLGAGFSEIDDPTMLQGVSSGSSYTPHFRPVARAWIELLYGCSGDAPLVFRLAGLALHAYSATVCALLAQRLLGRPHAALAAAAVFAALPSSSEAVQWISASNGLLSVAAALSSALAWDTYLCRGSRRAFLAAHAAAAIALGCKQDALVLVPLWLGLDLARNGRAALAPRALARRYALLALLVAAYLPLAYQPDLWRDDPGVGRFHFGPELLPEWLGNFALLFSLRQFEAAERAPAAVACGLALVLGTGALAFVRGERGRVLALGLALALVGLLPALPGPMQVAGTRLCYASAPGVALLAAALWEAAESAASRLGRARLVRGIALAALVAWTGAGVLAIRSVQRWRHAPRAARLATALAATRTAVADAHAAGARELVVIAPPLWSPRDYANAALHFIGGDIADAQLVWLASEADIARALEPGGNLAPEQRVVRAGQPDRTLRALTSRAEIETAARQALAAPTGIAASRNAAPVVVLALGPR
jgi:hypothetical protein